MSIPAGIDDKKTKSSVLELYSNHLGRARALSASVLGTEIEDSAEGAYVYTTEGRTLLNCAGYGVFLLGAGHPRVLDAVSRQLHRMPLSTRVLLDHVAPSAAAAVAAVAPGHLSRVHFSGSGTEAVEAAIKMARANGRRRLIAMTNGYHGKTMGALAATGNEVYRRPFAPMLSGVEHVDFGTIDELARALGDDATDASVILEPIQSEAGVKAPPPGYLKAVEQLCRTTGALLILDEVMTGLGRIGSWWGAEPEGVVADIVVAGKALSGGMVPVAATIATPDVFAPFDRDPYLHTSTFSAAPIAMAAVEATIDVIRSENIVELSSTIGARILSELRQRAALHPSDLVVEVRGSGLLIGVELSSGGQATEFILEMLNQGVIVNHSLNANSVVRITPPAVLDSAGETLLSEAFSEALAAMARQL